VATAAGQRAIVAATVTKRFGFLELERWAMFDLADHIMFPSNLSDMSAPPKEWAVTLLHDA